MVYPVPPRRTALQPRVNLPQSAEPHTVIGHQMKRQESGRSVERLAGQYAVFARRNGAPAETIEVAVRMQP